MSNIPKAAKIMEYAMGLSAHLIQVIQQAQELLPREKGLPRTPVKSRNITKALAAAIKSYKKVNPDASLQEIADHFMVNAGRVSEVLRGKRKGK